MTSASEGQTAGTFHVLLIGIDMYPVQPLSGCVNDIDAVQDLLLQSNLGIKPESIRRLVAPRTDLGRAPVAPEDLPTFANIRAALDNLANVGRDDRVFIYYSGHGKQVPVTDEHGNGSQREALVPKDFVQADGSYAWLYDYEINEALRKIAVRTTSVAMVLDSCHSAGAFRDPDARMAVRTLTDLVLAPVADPAIAERGLGRDTPPSGLGVAAWHVVAACRENEFARETTQDGKRHGLLTRAYVAAVQSVPVEDRAALTWDRIWHDVWNLVVNGYEGQRPWMDGNPRRAVFAGPPADGDAGITVIQDGGCYRVAAGTLDEITEGAELAIYDRDPARFPPLNSIGDRRLGVIRIKTAEASRAVGVAVDTPFAAPAGARGRVIKLGPDQRLRCAAVPATAEITELVANSGLVRLVDANDSRVDVRLELRDGHWLLIDDIHGGPSAAPALLALDADEAAAAGAVLDHYRAYSAAARMVRRIAEHPSCLDGKLEIRLLTCSGKLAPARAQEEALGEVEKQGAFYQLKVGAEVCVEVKNDTAERLQVELFDVEDTGVVSSIGRGTIEAGQVQRFWLNKNLGQPFCMTLPDGVDRARERLIAIGRTPTLDKLDHLVVARTFADVISETLDKKGMGAAPPPMPAAATAPTERWAATQVVSEIVRR